MAIPFLEKKLYSIQEESAHIFINNLVQRIDSESAAIDTYWKSTLDEQKKRLHDIVSIQTSGIVLAYENYSDRQKFISNVSMQLSNAKFSDNGFAWVMDTAGNILYHPNDKLIKTKAGSFMDFYGNNIYETINVRAQAINSGFDEYWVDSEHGLLSKLIFYKYIAELDLIFMAEIDSGNVDSEIAYRQQKQKLLLKELVRENKFRDSGYICVFNGSQTIIAHPKSEYEGKLISKIDNLQYGQIQQQFSSARDKLPESTASYFKAALNDQIIWVKYLDDYDWYLVLSVDKRELFQAANELKNLILFAAIAFLVVINIVTLLVVKSISNAIKKLSDTAKQVKRGDLSVRTDVVSNNEIGELAFSMNDMIHTIEQRTDSLAALNVELNNAKIDADDANQSKTRFLAAVSHDLLQPLTSAQLFSSLLQSETLSNQNANTVAKIISSLDSAKQLISELVEISKLNSGSVKPKIATFGLNDLFTEIEQSFSIQAHKAGINLKVVKTSVCVDSDRQLLRHIVNNLVSNAIRYTKNGKVLLGGRRIDNKVRIEVWDTGSGIPEHKQKEIFQEFVRVNSDEIAEESRFGLGLAIVDRIAKIMGYEISLRSTIGKGSVFSVQVPISNFKSNVFETVKLETNHLSASDLKGKTVLYIENEIDILDAMDRILSGWGCNAILASSGEEVLEILESESMQIDIILSDFHVGSNETGLEVIEQIFEKTGNNIPVVIITGDTSEGVKNSILNNNYELLYKPIVPNMLYSKILTII